VSSAPARRSCSNRAKSRLALPFCLPKRSMKSACLPGFFNMIFGGADLGRRLVEHPGIDMVSFTGSQAVGKAVMAAASGAPKPVALELGGKSAAIVLRDANLEAAVNAAFRLTVLNSGQVCVCQSRLLVPRGPDRDAISILQEAARGVVWEILAIQALQWPTRNAWPVRARQRHRRTCEDPGAHSVLDSTVGSVNSKGYFFPPTAFSNVAPESELAQQEVFGPVLAMIAFDSEEEPSRFQLDTLWPVRRRVVGRRFGCRAGSPSSSHRPGDCERSASQSRRPFGGFGQSGFGRENGRFSVETFTQLQAINQLVKA